jgi:predicted PurR-regulated permease PerM
LAVFGAVGLVLGPLILALTDAILQIWRHRTAHGKPAEAAT